MKLACPEYHIGMDGITLLTEEILEARGFSQVTGNIEDVVMCYNDIILGHAKITELWYNSYNHTSGPQVDKIIQNSLSVFPRLESTKVDDVVNFYDRLQEVGLSYVLGLLPFDAIVLTHGFEGLCPPGLGLAKYAAMSKAIMELVPRLIPSSLSPQVNAILASVRFESNNSYDYMWRILELTVPGFDPTIPIRVPTWSDADDIFHFAQAFLLFFRLQAKVTFHYDDRTRIGMILRAVQYTEFADSVTTLLSHVNSYWQEVNDGSLPAHLRLHGLAMSIHQTTQGHLRDIASPRVCFLQHDKYTGRSGDRAGGTSPQIQGVPQVKRLEQQRGHAQDAQHRGHGGGGEHRGGDSYDSYSGRKDSNSAADASPTRCWSRRSAYPTCNGRGSSASTGATPDTLID